MILKIGTAHRQTEIDTQNDIQVQLLAKNRMHLNSSLNSYSIKLKIEFVSWKSRLRDHFPVLLSINLRTTVASYNKKHTHMRLK